MSNQETILVTGATGKQGRAVVEALVASKQPYRILALTRSAMSGAARALAELPNTTIVEGTFDNPQAIFKAAGEKVDSVFLVTLMASGGDAESEERQGKAFIDAALQNSVGHLVFSSVNRNGDQPTKVPHFISKHNIEHYLKAQAGDKMGWTIVRPVAFMENFVPGMIGKVFGAMWYQTLGNKKTLQLVSTKDIGVIAAIALQDRKKYNHQAIDLAGDELTFEQANRAFKETVGIPAPSTFSVLGWAAKKSMKELSIMFQFFHDEGYNADIAKVRAIYPKVLTLKAWIEEESAYKRK